MSSADLDRECFLRIGDNFLMESSFFVVKGDDGADLDVEICSTLFSAEEDTPTSELDEELSDSI
jgi:hypothetical protein